MHNNFYQFNDNLGAKSLLLRSYFELFLQDSSYVKVLTAYSHSFERFLRRNEFSAKNVIKEYLNFTLILRKITKLIYEGKWNADYKKKYKENIRKERMPLKQWLLDNLKL